MYSILRSQSRARIGKRVNPKMIDTKAKELISIIIPIYRAEKYICECVDSVLAQSYKNLEIILIDDGSDDNCPQICERYSERDSRIKILHKRNEGSVAARKDGVSIAKGGYVTFVDSDDWIDNDYIENMYSALSHDGADMVISSFQRLGNFNANSNYFNRMKSGIYSGDEIKNLIIPILIGISFTDLFGISPAVWNKLYKRKLVLYTIRRIDDAITIGDDIICSFMSISLSNKLIIRDDIEGYHYRENINSITNHYDEKYIFHIEKLFHCLDENIDLLLLSNKQIAYYKAYMLFIGGIANITNQKIRRLEMLAKIYRYNKTIINNKILFDFICECNKKSIIDDRKIRKNINYLANKAVLFATINEIIK